MRQYPLSDTIRVSGLIKSWYSTKPVGKMSTGFCFYSSTNFIFLVILFIVIIKLFMATIEISNLEYRIKELSQKIAIDEKFEADSNDKDQKDS